MSATRLRMPWLVAWIMAAWLPCAAAADLKVATWNLEWLTARAAGDPSLPDDVVPKSPADWALLRRYALALDADVVALQEVDGPAVAAMVFPPDRYTLYFSNDTVIQRVGFAVRRGIAVRRNPDLVGLDLYPDAQFHLRRGIDITLDLPSGPLRMLGVHLKTGCQRDRLDRSPRPQCATIRGQVAVLQGWTAQRQADGAPFLMLGDFNRWMEGDDQVFAALQTSGKLVRATEGHGSPCWGGGNFIDHILAGGAARAWLDPGTLRVLVYREGADMKEHLSDHCPVSVKLHLPG